MTAVACVTVIRKGDLADRLLDHERNPDWNGIKTRMLETLPTNMDLWDRYADLRRQGPEGRRQADALYVSRQAEMDAGAKASWSQRMRPGEISAIQSAMNLRIRNRRVFEAEYQNEPLGPDEDINTPTLEGLEHNLNRVPRGLVPTDCNHLVAMIDCQQRALFWMILAASDDFTVHVIDYGTWPKQPRDYFALRDIRRTLARALDDAGHQGGAEAAILFGLGQLYAHLAETTFPSVNGGQHRIERIHVDSGDFTDTVYESIRRSRHAGLIRATKGYGLTAGRNPISQWKLDKGDQAGYGYVIKPEKKQRTRLVHFDTNLLKTFACHRRATVGRGSLSVFGNDPTAHRLLQDHCLAETCKPTEGSGRKLWEWKHKPHKPDNHLFDCLIGGLLALLTIGCRLAEIGTAPPPKPRRQRQITF